MQKKITIASIVVIVLSIVILFASQFTPFALAEGLFQSIFKGPKTFLYGVKSTEDSKTVLDLKKQNEDLTKKLADLERIKRENDALRSQFELSGQAKEDIVPARVVGFRGNVGNPTVLIIDKGKSDGVLKNSSVVVGSNLIGIIGEVGNKYSEVIMTTNSNFTTTGRSLESTASGILKGAGDFIVLDRVVITDTLKKGDVIVSRGDVQTDGTGVKPDLIIGKISEVNKNEAEPFQTARLETPVSFKNLEYVFIQE